jgi:hypothetical protein
MNVSARMSMLLVLAGSVPSRADDPPPVRSVVPVESGRWSFRVESAPEAPWTTPAILPAAFEEMAGIAFDGVGTYRLRLDRQSVPAGRRLLLRFDAVAAQATVSVDGKEIASHLGGWTPFRADLTDAMRSGDPTQPIEVLIRVDERVGHNTQGFLPIVQPHFGGIWQDVRLESVPETRIDDLRILAIGDVQSQTLRVEAPVPGATPGTRLAASWRRLGDGRWSDEFTAESDDHSVVRWSLPVANPALWSPGQPALYEVRLRIPASGDTVITRAAFRSIRADGNRLYLNDAPLTVRGVLDWGYAPPHLAPTPDLNRFRRELDHHHARGFNLIKFCLWVPPKAYLDACDEAGMLAWVEYPTWHPKLDGPHRDELKTEFAEFFAHDRNHPSVVLRSLTCETGTSSDLGVIRSLYDLGKQMVPGALIEDDSSWIAWQRIFDFYDDHPYGNNHTWVEELGKLQSYRAEHGPKPLVLGEAIAADTWADPSSIREAIDSSQPTPYWVPGFLDANAGWLASMRSRYGPGGLDRLQPESLRAALLMRKYQVETFRREIPDGGYVVSVHRDFPLAGMGLVDYLGRPKWPADDWSWHGPTTLVLTTPGDRRALARSAVQTTGQTPFRVQAAYEGGSSPDDTPSPVLTLDPPPTSDQPVRTTLHATLGPAHNAWPLWVVPDVRTLPPVHRHASVDDLTAALFDTFDASDPRAPIVARRFDSDLLTRLAAGACVLMLPDGQTDSFATSDHWFLRGGPYIPDHPLLNTIPRDLLVDLQAFDLAGRILPRIDPYLDQLDPLLLLWDNHDAKTTSTHALVFETRVGQGRLLVSALNHGPRDSAAGRWLLNVFLNHLRSGPEPKHSLDSETLSRLHEHLGAQTIDLSKRTWRFRPDPENQALALGWHRPETDDAGPDWSDIRIDAHWESQGHERLDGWALYRTSIDVPDDWNGRDVYLSFQGADDFYELYVDGQLAGSGGDIATKRTAFEDRTSHRVTALATPGRRHVVAVRVFDWYGSGGIFRPILLGTARIGPRVDWIR